eukprot:UN29485
MCYGQSESGKTYTMDGPPKPNKEQIGVSERLVHGLFNEINNRNKDEYKTDYIIRVSFYAMWREKLYDLLKEQIGTQTCRENMPKPRLTYDRRSVYIQRGKRVVITNLQDYLTLKKQAVNQKEILKANLLKSKNTVLDEKYLRTICILNVHRTDIKSGEVRTSKVLLLDLSLSDKLKKTHQGTVVEGDLSQEV